MGPTWGPIAWARKVLTVRSLDGASVELREVRVSGAHVIRHLDVRDNQDCGFAVSVFEKLGLERSNRVFYRNDNGGSGAGVALEGRPDEPVKVWNNVWYDNNFRYDAIVSQGIDFDPIISMGARGMEGIKNMAPGGDVRLAAGSPAIDGGTRTAPRVRRRGSSQGRGPTFAHPKMRTAARALRLGRRWVRGAVAYSGSM